MKNRIKRLCILSLFFALAIVYNCASGEYQEEDYSKLKITYSSPTSVGSAGNWTYAGIPVGNGKIGAKIYGGVDNAVYQLNDASFWAGGPMYADIYDETGTRKKNMEKTRSLLEGDLTDWNQIKQIESSAKSMVGNSLAACYLPVGNLIINFGEDSSYSNYERALDIDKAIVTTKYKQNGITYTRTEFASYPDNVMVVKLTADGSGNLNFTSTLKFPDEKEAGKGNEYTAPIGEDGYIMSWKAPAMADAGKGAVLWNDYGMTVEAQIKIISTNGNVSANQNGVTVSGADEAVLVYSSETSYNGFDKNPTIGSGEEKNPTPLLDGYIENADAKTYDELYEEHLKDYQNLFRRLWVDIDGADDYILAYQFKRYESISCNRSETFFTTGYGMWNVQMKPTSWGNHYMNENVIKQNSFLEAANLPETIVPIISWLEDLSENGKKTAQYDWGFRGWTAPHHSDIWATTALQSDGGLRTEYSIFPVGGIWTTLFAWEHYLYSKDEDFLRDKAYPIIKGAAEFACDLLVEREFTSDEISGVPGTYLVTSPSTSAENSYGLNHGQEYEEGLWQAVSLGSTQDMIMVRGIFEEYMKSCEILGIGEDFLQEVKDKYDRLLPYQIHKDGELQEWAFEDMKPSQNRDLYSQHRHASHLIGVWPYNQITQSDTKLFEAAKTALAARRTGTAARMPDKAAMHMRLGNPDEALKIIPTGKNSLIGQWLDSLQNSFAEFIVQSHKGYIDLLPALPTIWKNGQIKGTRVRGGYELDIKWVDGKLESCVVYAKTDNIYPEIYYNNSLLSLEDDRIVFVDDTKEKEEAENINANITNLYRTDDIIRMDYCIKSEDDNSQTKIYPILASYKQDGTMSGLQMKNIKLYNTQSETGNLKFDASNFVADGQTYSFKGFILKKSSLKPLCLPKEIVNQKFEVKEIYSSATDFSSIQGPVWYYNQTADNINFSELSSFDSSNDFWQGDYTYLRVGASFIHPETMNAVRTFKAPAEGYIKICKSTVKADDSVGTVDGIYIKIVKKDAQTEQTEQIYPYYDEYLEILRPEHLGGVIIPDEYIYVNVGDTINFIVNQGVGNGRDGTQWANIIQYVDEMPEMTPRPTPTQKPINTPEPVDENEYNSEKEFSNDQTRNWRYQNTDDEIVFTPLDIYVNDSTPPYWRHKSYSWLRVGGSFMHPDREKAVRTFVAPKSGAYTIKESLIKGEDNTGTSDGIYIRIVKESKGEINQIYPIDTEQKYLEILREQHLAGVNIADIDIDLQEGDNIHFILYQGDISSHDGTIWKTTLYYNE